MMDKMVAKKNNLFIAVAIGFVLGIALGLAAPQFCIKIKVVGDSYLNLIKMLITPIVFCSVYCGIVGIKDKKVLGKLGIRTIGLFTLLFVVCAVITVVICSIVKPGCGVVFDNIAKWEGSVVSPTVSSFLTKIIPSNLLAALVSGDTLSIILFTIVFAVASVVLSSSKDESVSRCVGTVERGIPDLKILCTRFLNGLCTLLRLG